SVMLGIINAFEQIIPVVSLRNRVNLPEQQVELSDQLILARTKRRKIAILVDNVSKVLSPVNQEFLIGENAIPNTPYLAGVLNLADGLLLIHDLDQFLSLEEEKSIDEVINTIDATVAVDETGEIAK